MTIAIVSAGTFQYRSRGGRVLMSPGSVLLGNAGESFECAHDAAVGDRCIAFHYAPAYFEQLAADAGVRATDARFRVSRIPPTDVLSSLVARACGALRMPQTAVWNEIALEIAARSLRVAADIVTAEPVSDSMLRRVTEVIRAIERSPHGAHGLSTLARSAGLSAYHFLRTFQRLTGVTPHQFVLRTRLRAAAVRLATSPERIIEVALESGFADVSNFNRAFRHEFGASPRAYRARHRRDPRSMRPIAASDVR